MTIRIHEIKLKPGEDTSLLAGKAERRLKLPAGCITQWRIAKESLDAREKPEIYRVFSLDILECTVGEETVLAQARRLHVKAGEVKEQAAAFPMPLAHAGGGLPERARPVIAGFGPCGIFAGLTLAKAGLRPIILERGACMEERVAAVETFWRSGKLDAHANVQFGEGGAGSFSDGKLTTGTKDPAHRLILQTFAQAGADPDILYKQHPHIGTDVLREVVVNLRRQIEALGGEIRFYTKLSDIEVENGRLWGVTLENVRTGESSRLETDALILALGHSARDSFRMLQSAGIYMEQKPFSMGVRIEHPQAKIDLAQFGAKSEDLGLWPAEYKLSCKTKAGRGVYTFCMCPGGYVVASASDPGLLCTNGMSNRARDAENANSGLLVDVRTEDFGSADPLAGVDFQEKYEKLAFALGGGDYRAPAQRVGDFLAGGDAQKQSSQRERSSDAQASSEAFDPSSAPHPSYRPGVTWTQIERCLPDFVAASLREALPVLGKKLKGFDSPDAILTAIESRSSSPVRIRRSAEGLAQTQGELQPVLGIYPAGEGAGYAGGIMSAAADGYHAAMRVLEELASSK